MPGSGKSYFTRVHLGVGREVVCSADHYFERAGKYNFCRSDLSKAHQASQDKADGLCLQNQPVVVIDNTHSCKWEMTAYLKIAEKYGYSVRVIHLKADPEICFKRQQHNVPREGFDRMMARWEPYPGEEIITPA